LTFKGLFSIIPLSSTRKGGFGDETDPTPFDKEKIKASLDRFCFDHFGHAACMQTGNQATTRARKNHLS